MNITTISDAETTKAALLRILAEPDLKPSWRFGNWSRFHELAEIPPLKPEVSVSQLWTDPLHLAERFAEIIDMEIQSRQEPGREDLKVRLVA